jgi:hypothetical protein
VAKLGGVLRSRSLTDFYSLLFVALAPSTQLNASSGLQPVTVALLIFAPTTARAGFVASNSRYLCDNSIASLVLESNLCIHNNE